MDKKNQIDLIRREMQSEWTCKLSDGTYKDVVTPLFKILAGLTQITNDDDLVFGDIDHITESRFRALLVTKSHFYYADFETRELLGEDSDVTIGTEVVDSYNLKIIPRAQLRSLTIDKLQTDDFSHGLSRVDFTINLPELDISIPIRSEYRNDQEEMLLLEGLNASLK